MIEETGYPSPERIRKVVADDDDYPPYRVRLEPMIQQAKQDEAGHMEFLVTLIACVVAGVCAGALLVVYGFF